MKKCPTCEGMGSLPDTFEPSTEKERIERNARDGLVGTILGVVFGCSSLVAYCDGAEERQLRACNEMCAGQAAQWESGKSRAPGRDFPPSCRCKGADTTSVAP